MKQKVQDGAIRVASYSRDHQVVVNDDGSIDVYRRPSQTADSGERTRAAFEAINRRNQEFWSKRDGMPSQ